ncbi:B12-binding domain-containing protein [Aquiflexum sp.]|uniref:cobalamin B12-binding domain-containing protein n=1 Tax=Aquiflexum sp. TaxID=1872584 RepID=UPI0035945794
MIEENVKLLAEKTSELANYITSLHFEHNPGLIKRYGTEGKHRCYEDAVFHLNFLAEALTMNLPDMYANYILWAAAMLKSRNIPESDLHHNLEFVQQAIHEILGTEFSITTKEYVDSAKEKLKEITEESISYISDDNPLKEEVAVYLKYLLQGKRREATILITELIEQGILIKDIYQFIFQVSQYEVGLLWQCNKITVAHEHYCTAATQQIMSGLYHHIFSATRKGKTLVACSITGELHELGIRMVTDFFEMEGWDTYYLGANMPDNQLQEALTEYKADVLALSVTLPTHVSKAASLIKKIRSNEDFNHLKIMVGGYPFITNPDLWKKVAADAYAQNANEAITRANDLVNQ